MPDTPSREDLKFESGGGGRKGKGAIVTIIGCAWPATEWYQFGIPAELIRVIFLVPSPQENSTMVEQASKMSVRKILEDFWNTQYTSESSDQETLIKKTFRELVIYLVFLIFVCIIAFGMASTNMYYYTKVMMDLFLEGEESENSFRTISSAEDFWKFAEGRLLDGLYWDKWYNGDPLPPNTAGYIYYENRLLGVPRLRQLRVSTNSCTVNEEFETFISDCYAMYSEQNEDKNPFGRNVQDPNETAWVYQTQADLEGFTYWGKITTYSGGGYVKDLDLTKTRSEEYIAYLKNSLWVQRGARAVFISFSVYNANINLFCVITLLVEFPATGGAIPTWSFNTVKLIRYVTTFDHFIMACEIIFVIFIVYYTIEEVIEINVTGLKYFGNLWNVLDILLVLISIACITFNVYRTSTIKAKLNNLLKDPLKYANFDNLGFWEMRFNNTVAITVFFAWIKIFKYISFNKTMTQLSTTLSRCAKDLLGFFIMFFIVFLAFTQLGYLLFGTQVQDFSTFMNSFFTLFRIILGDFNFYQLEQANRVLGPIFFMLFVFFVFFVLINMFLAIINDTYSEVKSDMAKKTDMFIMSDYLKMGYNKIWDKLGTKRSQVEKYEIILGTGKKIPFDEWKQQLLEQNFNEDEIEDVFAKYDVDGDRQLDPNEQEKMLLELQKLKKNIDATKKGDASNFEDMLEEEDSDAEQERGGELVHANEFLVLSRRVDRVESTLIGIVNNIETVLAGMSDMKR